MFVGLLTALMLISITACGNSSSSGAMSVTSGSVPGQSESDGLPNITWKMASCWSSGHVHFTVDKRFSELVSQMTDGKFTITNYAEGELCAANQLFDYVSQGTVQCGGDWGGYWSGRNTAFEMLSTTMDSFSGTDMYTWIKQAGGLEEFQNLYGQYGMTYFPLTVTFNESGIRSNTPITSLDDMRHLKIRIGGVLAGRVAEKLGINATMVNGNELYESLQRGVVDAAEFSCPNADYSAKLHEVTQYLCVPAWYQSAAVNGVMVNKEAWDALPEAYQEAFASAASACLGEQFARYLWMDVEATEAMLESGMQVTTLNDEDLQIIRDTCTQVYEEEAAVNPDLARIYASMQDYTKKMDAYREMMGDYGFGFVKEVQ